jgi:DNA-binding Lrp family transcriptional regulator
MATSNSQFALVTSAGFLLDQIRLGRGLLDFVDGLIVVGVTQANVEQVLRDPALQRAYATYDAPPPDALRRPITVNAVAQSLGLPFETVRRRVQRLTVLGVFNVDAAGVRTRTPIIFGALHRRAAEAAYERVPALHQRLSALPELQGLPVRQSWIGPPPVRAAARISGEYLLRIADQLRTVLGDPVDAVIWLELLRSGTEQAVGQARTAGSLGRDPIGRAAIARRLGLPVETVRRRLVHLTSIGACEPIGSGLVVSPDILAEPRFTAFAERHLADLRRMFAGLAQLGALPIAASEGGQAAA